jgi:hypothetical protein
MRQAEGLAVAVITGGLSAVQPRRSCRRGEQVRAPYRGGETRTHTHDDSTAELGKRGRVQVELDGRIHPRTAPKPSKSWPNKLVGRLTLGRPQHATAVGAGDRPSFDLPGLVAQAQDQGPPAAGTGRSGRAGPAASGGG